jgi:hypothetical protein
VAAGHGFNPPHPAPADTVLLVAGEEGTPVACGLTASAGVPTVLVGWAGLVVAAGDGVPPGETVPVDVGRGETVAADVERVGEGRAADARQSLACWRSVATMSRAAGRESAGMPLRTLSWA